ncbi:putative dimethylallyl tryptophan synthase [Aspergillus karnatakaensis]|uniref:putative dimethylallyl tryptophan synthase n=1 Tax=Aspergillus karnatakaensis TaxID=1810916 RepID=UPI003CCD27B3
MPWRILGKALGFPDREQELWWLHASPFINNLLAQSNYHLNDQYYYLSFIYKSILPALGPFPRPGLQPSHLSVFSPEGHTLEPSLNFKSTRSSVRLGFEAIGAFAGTEHDPLNSFRAHDLLGKIAQTHPNVNLQWFNYFHSQLGLPVEEARTTAQLLPPPMRSTNQLAVDFSGNQTVVMKVYFPVQPKAVATRTATPTVAFSAIDNLDADFGTSLSLVKEYLHPESDHQSDDQTKPNSVPPFEALLIGIDCVSPELSRLKLYIYNTHFCLENIRAFWTLGGRLTDPATLQGLAIAEKLWEFLGFSEVELGEATTEKLPLMINYEMKQKAAAPKPQLYLPVQDKCDEAVADGLTGFFEYLEWEGLAGSYKRDLVENFSCRDLAQTVQVQRWVVFSYTDSAGVYLTLYYHGASGEVGSLY